MLLKLYQAGQPILRQKAQAVSKAQLSSRHVQEVIDFMIATLRDAPGVGLAAPQVGESLRIIIIEDKQTYHKTVDAAVLKAEERKAVRLQVLVNPKITTINREQRLFFEGCLSIDGYTAAVKRSAAVQVQAMDREGTPLSFTARGWHARVLQHELDHLDGRLYIDCMQSTSFMTIKNFTLVWRTALPAKINRIFDTGVKD